MPQGHFQVAFLGDSVMWGQGLLDAHKFSTLLVGWINQWHPAENAYKTVVAHSGAVIGVSATPGHPALDGEVPSSYPTILEQVDAVPGSPADVDLVVINGGINDGGVQYIFSPNTDQEDLADTIHRACYADLSTLLLKTATRFSNPNTQILVPGYHLVLSTQSSLLRIPTLMPLLGVSLSTFITPFDPLSKIVSNSLLFWKRSAAAMQQAVADVNRQLGTARLGFVLPAYQEANAAFAPTPWTFAVSADLSPQDEVFNSRKAACQANEPDLVQREFCYRASAGHPNVSGADAFFKALFPLLQQRYGF